jgi:sugar phosphate isomerase/epimerase
VDDAVAAGVTLAIEPMHPIYAADRGVISTLGQALDVAEQFPAATVGVVVDTFHVWWDPQLAEQLKRAGAGGRIAGYQVCDWITPLPADALLARGMMGDGHIDVAAITAAVSDAGYTGDIEVEIFNQGIWDADRPRSPPARLGASRRTSAPDTSHRLRTPSGSSSISSRAPSSSSFWLSSSVIRRPNGPRARAREAPIAINADR